jgi:hypothetical protein
MLSQVPSIGKPTTVLGGGHTSPGLHLSCREPEDNPTTADDIDDGPDVGYGAAPDENWWHPHAIRPIAGGAPEAEPEPWGDFPVAVRGGFSAAWRADEREVRDVLWGYE